MRTVWKGSVRSLVDYAAGTDARETVVDAKTGAEIAINISDAFGENDEPFYIWYKDELYDAYDRKDAVRILSNIRKGKKYPDVVNPHRPVRARCSAGVGPVTLVSKSGIRYTNQQCSRYATYRAGRWPLCTQHMKQWKRMGYKGIIDKM